MRKIGLFGGTFNPVHNGHLTLARCFKQSMSLDEVWLMVSPQNPFKRNDVLLADADRLNMVSEAIKGMEHMVASDYEFHLPVPSYTWDTLCHLRSDYPSVTFSLLIGSDNWVLFDRWYEHDKIMQNHEIAVYPRAGWPVDADALPSGVCLLDTPHVNVSSTQIRDMIASGKSVEGLVPPAVERILQDRGFYANS